MGYSLGRGYHPSGKLLMVMSTLIQHHASLLFAGRPPRCCLCERDSNSYNVRDKVQRMFIQALPDSHATCKQQCSQMTGRDWRALRISRCPCRWAAWQWRSTARAPFCAAQSAACAWLSACSPRPFYRTCSVCGTSLTSLTFGTASSRCASAACIQPLLAAEPAASACLSTPVEQDTISLGC